MRFSKEAIQQGRMNQEASSETPETFGMLDGVAQYRPGRELSIQNNRMAGTVGARALAMMNNPEEIKRTADWMAQFGMSNQGVDWNMGKMGGMMPPPAGAPPAPQGGQEASPPPEKDAQPQQ